MIYMFNALLNRLNKTNKHHAIDTNTIGMQSCSGSWPWFRFSGPRTIQCLKCVPKLKTAITADAQCNRECVRVYVYPMKGKQHLNLSPTIYHLRGVKF